MRTILFLNPVGITGGGERSLLDVMAAIRQTDPSLTLHLIAGTPGPLLEEAAALGAAAEVLPMPEAFVRLGDSSLSSSRSYAAELVGLLANDFSLRYVVEHSSRDMPPFLVAASFYSGQQGSLLYWALALAIFSAVDHSPGGCCAGHNILG